MRSVRAHPVPHAVAFAGALGFVATTVGIAWLLGWITDNVIVADSVERTAPAVAAAAVIVVSVASGVSVLLRRWYLAMAELRTQRDWRRGLLHRYLDLPMDFHRERAPGELLAHADSDVNTATMVLKPLAFAVSVLVLVVVTMVVLFLAHPLLALIAAVVFPALAVISRIYTRKVEAPSAEVQRRVGEVSEVAHESFDGAVVVKTLGREQLEVERMRAASERLRDERVRVGRMRGTFEPALDALPTMGAIRPAAGGGLAGGPGRSHPGGSGAGHHPVLTAGPASADRGVLPGGDAPLGRVAGAGGPSARPACPGSSRAGRQRPDPAARAARLGDRRPCRGLRRPARARRSDTRGAARRDGGARRGHRLGQVNPAGDRRRAERPGAGVDPVVGHGPEPRPRRGSARSGGAGVPGGLPVPPTR